eukprot:NODE_7396_length_1582_cov_9.515464.p1 GENE.NODE_7396_length_1582_cov_9.515464~~NODE_7396_length_1582_cov_9.515464.p1  ORF type:complete len:279 (-),score=92.62 NODE_7396_length_1582_cov_9.515464:203-1039(-)
MNDQFERFGIRIIHFTVRMVSMPADLANSFETKTLFESRTEERVAVQAQNSLKLAHNEARTKLAEQNTNARLAAEEEMVTTQAQLSKDTREVIACTAKDLAMIEARRDAQVADLHASCTKQAAQISAEMIKLQTDLKSQTRKETQLLQATSVAFREQKAAEAKRDVAARLCEGKTAVVQAEGAAATAFQARRQQESEVARLGILSKVAGNKCVRVATTMENNSGLALDNSTVTQAAQQSIEAFRTKLAELTAGSATNMHMGKSCAGGLVRPVPQDMVG